MSEKTCGTCKWWDRDNGTLALGWCGDGGGMVTNEWDGCSKHELSGIPGTLNHQPRED